MTILEDRLAIQDVMTNYAAGVDDRDMAQYRRCFADDVEIVGFGGDAVVQVSGLRATSRRESSPRAYFSTDPCLIRQSILACHWLHPIFPMSWCVCYLARHTRHPYLLVRRLILN